jgi:hypothetical protein
MPRNTSGRIVSDRGRSTGRIPKELRGLYLQAKTLIRTKLGLVFFLPPILLVLLGFIPPGKNPKECPPPPLSTVHRSDEGLFREDAERKGRRKERKRQRKQEKKDQLARERRAIGLNRRASGIQPTRYRPMCHHTEAGRRRSCLAFSTSVKLPCLSHAFRRALYLHHLDHLHIFISTT